MWRICGFLVFHLTFAQQSFNIPDAKLQAFARGGVRVSIPDSPGIELFAFHGNLNKPLKDVEAGHWNRDIVKSRNGRWTFEEPDVRLKLGDVIYYWIFVQVDGLGYTKTNQYWIVSSYDIDTEDRVASHAPKGMYEVPDAKLEALYPKGIRVSIPDEPGVELFAFHGRVNTPLTHDLEAGAMSRDVVRSKNGRWVYQDDNVRLKNGDVIYYWLFVIVDGLGYQKLNQKWIVTGLGDSHTTTNVVSETVVPPVTQATVDKQPVTQATVDKKPVTQTTVDKQPASGDCPQIDFKLPDGMELMVVVKEGKLLLKKPLPSQIAFENAESVNIGYCKTTQICVPSVEITQHK